MSGSKPQIHQQLTERILRKPRAKPLAVAALLEGLWLVNGEYDMMNRSGLAKEQIVMVLSAGCLASLILATFIGIFSDALKLRKSSNRHRHHS